MPTLPNAETLPNVEPDPVEQPSLVQRRDAAIRSAVLNALGRPPGFLKVAILPLWGNKVRVNVWAGGDGTGNSIPNSYFVTVDDHGAVLQSNPPIQKLY